MVINSSKKYNRQGLVLPCCRFLLQRSYCQILSVMEKQRGVPYMCTSEVAMVAWCWPVHQNEHPTMHALDIKLLQCHWCLQHVRKSRVGSSL